MTNSIAVAVSVKTGGRIGQDLVDDQDRLDARPGQGDLQSAFSRDVYEERPCVVAYFDRRIFDLNEQGITDAKVNGCGRDSDRNSAKAGIGQVDPINQVG